MFTSKEIDSLIRKVQEEDLDICFNIKGTPAGSMHRKVGDILSEKQLRDMINELLDGVENNES